MMMERDEDLRMHCLRAYSEERQIRERGGWDHLLTQAFHCACKTDWHLEATIEQLQVRAGVLRRTAESATHEIFQSGEGAGAPSHRPTANRQPSRSRVA